MAEWSIATVLKTVIPTKSGSGVRIPPPPPENVVNFYVKLGIWIALVGSVFAYLWAKGHLLKVSTYVQETREELKKCTWPSWEELKGSTVVVMISSLLLGVFIVTVDFAIAMFVKFIQT